MNRFRQFAKSALTTVLPKSLLLTRGVCAANSLHREIALTFDDGPHPEHTPRVLDALAAANAQATFFVIGEKAQQHPDLIRRIVADGHDVGNHTWSHREPAQVSTADFRDEVRRTRQLLQDLTGRDCWLTRPPKGQLSVGKALALWQSQQTIVLWNVDPKDFALHDNAEMLRWLDGYRPKSGDILLLHDNHPLGSVVVERLSAGAEVRIRFVTSSQFVSSRRNPKVTGRQSGTVSASLQTEVAHGR